jgi:hypothetical protein
MLWQADRRRQINNFPIRPRASLADYAVRSQMLIATASDLSRLAVKEEPLQTPGKGTSMSTSSKTAQPAKTDLASNYGPIGLKAVTAAHLMLKRTATAAKKSA